jgi:hypothetical protein
MLIRRIAALLASLFALALVTVTPALATSGPDYPPGVGGNDTGVQGTNVGREVGNNVGGLPHTGFEVGLMWTALAFVVLGVVLLAVSRRRARA